MLVGMTSAEYDKYSVDLGVKETVEKIYSNRPLSTEKPFSQLTNTQISELARLLSPLTHAQAKRALMQLTIMIFETGSFSPFLDTKTVNNMVTLCSKDNDPLYVEG